jgi:hypothetical protein
MDEMLAIFPQLLRHASQSDETREQAVLAAWITAVGPQIRRATCPIRVERKTLIVAVRDATWRAQLTRLGGQVLFKLNSLLGSPLVTAVEFVINPSLIVEDVQPSREFHFVAPDEQASQLLDDAEGIPDPDLRAVFLRAAGKCLERRAR